MRTLFVILFLSITVALGQNFPAIDGFVATDSNKINVESINRTAGVLKAVGIEPLVLFIDGDLGESLTEVDKYLDNATRYYFADNNPNSLILLIGTKPLANSNNEKPLYVSYGENLRTAMEAYTGTEKNVDRIRNQIIIPHLIAGNFDAGIQAGLLEIKNVYQKTTSNSTNQTTPIMNQSQNTNIPKSTDNTVNYMWSIFLLVLIPLIAYLFFRKRRRVSTESATSKEELDLGKQIESTKESFVDTLVELTQSINSDNYFPKDPQAQHNMLAITEILKEERSQEVFELNQEYQDNYSRLMQISKEYNEISSEEASTSHTMNEYKGYLAKYQALLSELNVLKDFAGSLATKRSDLELEIKEIAKRRTVVSDLLEQSQEVYQKMHLGTWPDSSKIYSPFNHDLYEIKNLEIKKPFAALANLKNLEENLQTVNDAVSEVSHIETKIKEFEPWLESKKSEGYVLGRYEKLLNELEQKISLTQNLLTQNEYKVLDAQVEEVKELAEEVFEGSQHFVSLYEDNKKRFKDIESDSQRVKKAIEKAQVVFDLVDEYAPDSWADIKGNGSEAQKAAEQAYSFYEKAKELNSFEKQSFDVAANLLDMADAELKRAEELALSIEKRLKQLQHAQKVARDELKLVKQDLQKDWSYLKQPKVDRLVGKKAEELMQEAAEKITDVDEELNKTKPNWLFAIKNIQLADQLVDEALETIRSEEELMKHKQVLMKSEKAEAEAALERVLEFARVHPQDISQQTKGRIEEAQSYYLQGLKLEKESSSLSEQNLKQAYDSATSDFDKAAELATEAYELAEADFKEMEKLREDAAEATASAEQAYDNLLKIAKQGRIENSIRSSLFALAKALPQYYSLSTRDELLDNIKTANRVEEEIARAQAEARSYIKQIETQRRQERLKRLQQERLRRARQVARQRAGWGSAPIDLGSIIFSSPPRRSRIRTTTRMPVAKRATSVRLPTIRSGGSIHRSGGGWGGNRKSGGGW